MKRIYFILLVILSFCNDTTNAQLSLDSQLRSFPIKHYLKMPIDSLLANLPAGYDTVFSISGTSNINRGASLQINYPPNNEYWIYINITDAKYITVYKRMETPPEVAWPLKLLRKEKIGSIIIGRAGYEIIQEVDIY